MVVKYQEFQKIVSEFEEKENGKLYDTKGRFRAYFNKQDYSLQLTTRYCFQVTEEQYVCGVGWMPSAFQVFDRETKTILVTCGRKEDCCEFLKINYPKYEDPLAYWS